MGAVRYRVVQNNGRDIVEEIHKIVVYRFFISDVDDPDLIAADPIHKWESSDAGKFIMEHAIDIPHWQRQLDYNTYGYQYVIIAELEKKKLSEYYLRWGRNGSHTL